MNYRRMTLTAALSAVLCHGIAQAEEINLKAADNTEMSVSIYNQNLAMVRDVRKVKMPEGISEIAFEGVAQQMKPETALLSAEGVKILEQNYEYDLLTLENMLEESIGKTVKTVMTNPADGQNIFGKAVLVNSNYGNPILKFNYGIEANFPGRVVFEEVPDNLKIKPTLEAKIENSAAGDKQLALNYLTNGLSWQANYVAEVNGDAIDLQGWVTLNNQSGADYKNAKVQLVAGRVKQIETNMIQPRMMMAAKAAGYAADAVAESASLPAERLSDYYIYELPVQTDIMNKQSKQVSLMDIKNVKYSKEYKLVSSLYMGNQSEFEKAHPDLIYKITNNKDSNLDLPMPAGAVRFYTPDAKGTMQFTGASDMPQLAKGEEAELAVGQVFDLTADGKVKKITKLADKINEVEAEVEFRNASSEEKMVKFVQNFYSSPEVVSESLKSTAPKARSLEWQVKVPAEGKTVLTYKVRLVRN